ncbi:GntR family transcriptional regulator [Rhodobacterales bacterium HKCCE2091]|nr:GntR family transcriptional regulator [Rhodobacterales bacterium HKCCE2091]
MTEPTRAEPLPAYLRIAEMITRDIASGRYAEGHRLPPERDLAPEFGVSVGTLRKALAELAGRGLLTRRHGSGNYIRYDARAVAGYALFRLELHSGPGEPRAEPLSIDRVAKPDMLSALGPAPDAIRIRRLRFLSDTPVAVEEIWLDGRFPGEPGREAAAGSLYRHYQEALDLWILDAEDRLAMGTVPDWAPDTFGPRPGAPCPRIDRIARDQHGRPAEMSITHFDPDRAVYVARLP